MILSHLSSEMDQNKFQLKRTQLKRETKKKRKKTTSAKLSYQPVYKKK